MPICESKQVNSTSWRPVKINWWLILGYFSVIGGGLSFLGIYFTYKDKNAWQDGETPHPIVGGILGLFGTIFWMGIGIWAFSKVPSYEYDKELASQITGFMIIFSILTVVVGL